MHEADDPFARSTFFRCGGFRCSRRAVIDGGYCSTRCHPDREDDGPCDWCGERIAFDEGVMVRFDLDDKRLCASCFDKHESDRVVEEENDSWWRYACDHGSLSDAERSPSLLR